ncbi:MAG: HDOD domain-containing protein, partial [bacterium]|nr:HDOD domain-containing protein [bacterium]
PEVALKILELSSRKNSQPKDYADVLKNDAALTGRLLKLSNSAIFAQRRAVTTIDRACLVLGMERLKSISLGFHLSRAAASGGDQSIAREVWGQSVFRGCLSSEIARFVAPSLVSEAFAVGMMMDAGQPLMCSILGDPFRKLMLEGLNPARLFRKEFESLPYTHVDVITALAKRWKLPELLAKPLEWHHTRPTTPARNEPVHRLHRIAFSVGMLELAPGTANPDSTPLSAANAGVSVAQRILDLNSSNIQTAVSRSITEYGASIDLFSQIAEAITDIESIQERVQMTLVSELDASVERSVMRESTAQSERFVIGGQCVELGRESDGRAVAYLFDSAGQRLLSHHFIAAKESPLTLTRALGLEPVSGDDFEQLGSYIKAIAA